MPSWVTHLVTANKLDIKDKNSFLFGNIMPDILNNYIVEDTNVHKDYKITHYTNDIIINDIEYEFPNPDKFWKKYKENMNNPTVIGCYIHLLTDYYWNKLSYEKYFTNHNGFVEVKFVDGTTKEYEYHPAIKIKQSDFRIFTQYLKNKNKIDRIEYSDDLLYLSKQIVEIPLIKEDIYKTLNVVDKYLYNDTALLEEKYKLYTQDVLNQYLEESINYIISKLNETNNLN